MQSLYTGDVKLKITHEYVPLDSRIHALYRRWRTLIWSEYMDGIKAHFVHLFNCQLTLTLSAHEYVYVYVHMYDGCECECGYT